MFEIAEVGNRVAKSDYEAATPALRVDLLNAQFDLKDAPFPVVILLAGDDLVGGDELINLLHAWLDARYIDTRVLERPTREESERPRFWRYWRALPARGRIGVIRGGWVISTIGERARERIDDAEFDLRIGHVQQFERALTDDGALLLKFWLHLPRKELKRRLRKARNNPAAFRYAEPADRAIEKAYSRVMPLAERFVRKTSTAAAPWQIIESTDSHYRDLTVARGILQALTERLTTTAIPAPGSRLPDAAVIHPGTEDDPSEKTITGMDEPHTEIPRGVTASPATSKPPLPGTPGVDLLGGVDLTRSLPYESYKPEITRLQARLGRLSLRARDRGVSSVVVFEGWDAAGKGGAIRRLTGAMNAAHYKLVSIAAPTDEEKAHHYLWRFWRQLPRAGRMLIFDRSWYGRVLVERVEGFARPDEWRRAYAEINDFEEQFVEHGTPVFKFWLQIDPDEQLRRLDARAQTPYKKYKLTDEDYRNRARWYEYTVAANEMIVRTSTEIAPWHLIAANDKRHARVEVLRIICDGLKSALKADRPRRRTEM